MWDSYGWDSSLRKGRRRPTCRLYKNRPAGFTQQNHPESQNTCIQYMYMCMEVVRWEYVKRKEALPSCQKSRPAREDAAAPRADRDEERAAQRKAHAVAAAELSA